MSYMVLNRTLSPFTFACGSLYLLGSFTRSFVMSYYFDVLTLHPQPEYFESLTSYLMRLAMVNTISSLDGISTLFFPHQDRRITRDMADYPPTSFDRLATAGVCDVEALRKTTFFHITAKFGRSVLPQPVSRFLSGCISQHLRYCPICLSEQKVNYYLLPWRFLMLTCCSKHRCRLLEACGHCEELIPLFTSPFVLGKCPRCQRRLELCTSALVSDKGELEMVAHIYADIIFLLSPQLWEIGSSSIIKRVGKRFAYIRQINRVTAVEVASQINVTLTIIEGIERGDFQSRGATLQSYFGYAHYLGLSLKEIFSDVIDVPDDVSITPPPACPICQQSHCITRYGYNRSGSQRYLCQYCHRSFTASPKARVTKKHF